VAAEPNVLHASIGLSAKTGSATPRWLGWITIMVGLFANLPLVFGQEAGGGGTWSVVLMYYAPVLVAVYFLLIWPHQQQERKRRKMIDALKKNDKIITTGGIYGTVVSVDPKQDKVVVRVDDEKGVKLAMARSGVGRVIEVSEKPTDAS
jgi:preprotein translocase subunit YajC